MWALFDVMDCYIATRSSLVNNIHKYVITVCSCNRKYFISDSCILNMVLFLQLPSSYIWRSALHGFRELKTSQSVYLVVHHCNIRQNGPLKTCIDEMSSTPLS